MRSRHQDEQAQSDRGRKQKQRARHLELSHLNQAEIKFKLHYSTELQSEKRIPPVPKWQKWRLKQRKATSILILKLLSKMASCWTWPPSSKFKIQRMNQSRYCTEAARSYQVLMTKWMIMKHKPPLGQIKLVSIHWMLEWFMITLKHQRCIISIARNGKLWDFIVLHMSKRYIDRCRIISTKERMSEGIKGARPLILTGTWRRKCKRITWS